MSHCMCSGLSLFSPVSDRSVPDGGRWGGELQPCRKTNTSENNHYPQVYMREGIFEWNRCWLRFGKMVPSSLVAPLFARAGVQRPAVLTLAFGWWRKMYWQKEKCCIHIAKVFITLLDAKHLEDDNSSVWVLDCSITLDSDLFAQNAEPLWIDSDL